MTQQDAGQRFQNAVQILVDEKGRIKERLLIAYVAQLSHIDPERDLPKDMIPEFDGLMIRVGEDEVVGDTGNASKEIERMSEEQAAETAEKVFAMFLRLSGAPAG